MRKLKQNGHTGLMVEDLNKRWNIIHYTALPVIHSSFFNPCIELNVK